MLSGKVSADEIFEECINKHTGIKNSRIFYSLLYNNGTKELNYIDIPDWLIYFVDKLGILHDNIGIIINKYDSSDTPPFHYDANIEMSYVYTFLILSFVNQKRRRPCFSLTGKMMSGRLTQVESPE